MFEERDRLVVHGVFHVVREFGKAARIHAFALVELIEAEPLAEELGRQPPRLRIDDHSPHLPLNPLGICQLTRAGRAPQLVIGNRRPEKITEATGHLPICERPKLFGLCKFGGWMRRISTASGSERGSFNGPIERASLATARGTDSGAYFFDRRRVRRLLDAVKELWRDQDACQQRPNRLAMIGVGADGFVVERSQALFFP